MGNRVSHIADDDSQEFPWFHIIQWASIYVPAGHVLKYDVSAAKGTSPALCDSQSDLRKSILEEDVTDFILPTFQEDPENEAPITNDHEDPNPIEFAAALLDLLPHLSIVRYELVPSHLSEDVFWRKFFSLLRRRILATIVSYFYISRLLLDPQS